MFDNEINMEEFIGKTFKEIKIDDLKERILFIDDRNIKYVMYHDQDCCESVSIDDICGDLNDIIGSPILLAECVTNQDDPPADMADSSYTWTFYKFSTIKGSITIKWFGTSNGYYSEEVSIKRIN